jgi:histidinol phosphatase-like PHP family hydrolase
LCGLEAEYHRSQYDYYYKLRHTKGIDYMILGNHNMGNPNKAIEFNMQHADLEKYGKQLKDACASGLFSCIAHPD